MRPGRIRPGKREAGDRHQLRDHRASMRPGRIRPGKHQSPARTGLAAVVASMRPGRIRPGKACAWVQVPAFCDLGFNEAGANPPRKAPRGRRSRARLACYNEAGANPPRKALSSVTRKKSLPS